MPSWPGIFQFSNILSVALGNSRCRSASGPPSNSCYSFFMLFILSIFLICSFCSHILTQNCFASFANTFLFYSSCIQYHFYYHDNYFLLFSLYFSLFPFIFIIIIIYSFRVFPISVSWWFFTGVWVTASLLKSPGLVSVYWPIATILLVAEERTATSQDSGRSQQCCHLDSLYPSANFQVLQAFFNSLARSRYLSFFSHSFRFILWLLLLFPVSFSHQH